MAKTIDKFTAYGMEACSMVTNVVKKGNDGQYLNEKVSPDDNPELTKTLIQRTGNMIEDNVFDAVPVVGDNVIQQFWDGNDDIHDFPPLIPPYEKTRVEAPTWDVVSSDRLPSDLRPTFLRAKRYKYRMGILYTSIKVVDGKFNGLAYTQGGLSMPHGWSHSLNSSLSHPTYTDASYWCSALLFYDLGKADKLIRGPIAYAGFPLDERGYFMPDESTRICNDMFYMERSKSFLGQTREFVQTAKTRQGAKVLCFQMENDTIGAGFTEVRDDPDAMFTAISGMLYCIGLMNCRNIDTVIVVPPKGLSKKFKKKSGRPLLKYRVITVEQSDSGKVKTIRGRKHQDDRMIAESEMPQHIVRGHFKTYSKDRPLFGKYSGTWWWHHATKGAKSQGEIVHEYEVA